MFANLFKFALLTILVNLSETINFRSPSSDSAKLLWNLSSLALKLRENPELSEARARYPYRYPPYPYPRPSPPTSFMDVLYSVETNDDLQCVPRLLCELTSSPSIQNNQQSSLPFNINMGSIAGLLSTFNRPDASPLLYFGKAALLGYTSRGNSDSCTFAYPRCPRDADRLVDYLNNYNGGFFRYFNREIPNSPQNNQNQFGMQGNFKFSNEIYSDKYFSDHKNFAFPHDVEPYRRGKGFSFQEQNGISQRPFFTTSDRTGTGNFRLDVQSSNEPAIFKTSDRTSRYVNFNDNSRENPERNDVLFRFP